MFKSVLATVLALSAVFFSGQGHAQDRETIGYGRLFNNDFIGDGHDRWRTGSYSFSVLRGTPWQGRLPEGFGAVLEYRLRSEIIAPMRVRSSTGADRPYVGMVSAGVHSHFAVGRFDASVGADVVVIGPQTRLSEFQEFYHDALSMPDPLGTDTQLGNATYLAGTGELAWPIRVSDMVSVRPFVEAQAGVEDLVRVGADIVIGPIGHDDLVVRDGVTGQLIRAVEGQGSGVAFVAGADWAQVAGSVYLPEDEGYEAEDMRWRARAGVNWQFTPDISVFYGVTYLSEEFVGQQEGQYVGGLKLNFNF